MRIWWLSILLFACSPARFPDRTIELHADPEFTQEERALIGAASDRLANVGIHYAIVYDKEPGNRMRRVTVAQMAMLDTLFGGSIFGAKTEENPFKIFVFYERIPTSKMFLHVVMHEMLHGAGAPHVDDPRAVMYRLSRPGVWDAVWLNETDLAAIPSR